METILKEIKILYVKAEGGPSGGKEAFDRLEAKVGLKGRKFYGTYHNDEYRACVAMREDDNPSELGLETGSIPGGKYVKS